MKKKWKPEIGKKYYTIQPNGSSAWVYKHIWENNELDKCRLKDNNVFKTKAEAEFILKSMPWGF